MPALSLRDAAAAAGTSKSTILRAIQSGRLSATRLDGGYYAIDPAELFRVYAPKPPSGATDRSANQSMGQDATGDGTDATGSANGGTEQPANVVRAALLEVELAALKHLLESERRRAEEIREDRDRWHAQAERLALPAPARTPPSRPWWKRIAS